MADLKLKGRLNLVGNLTLKGSGGKVLVEGLEVLVEAIAPTDSHQGTAPPVILPPPPATPADAKPQVWVINSFNKTVKADKKPIVTLGLVSQGEKPTWPGMVLPSKGNAAGPVTVNRIPINVLGDQAIIFPSGGTAMLNVKSGQ